MQNNAILYNKTPGLLSLTKTETIQKKSLLSETK